MDNRSQRERDQVAADILKLEKEQKKLRKTLKGSGEFDPYAPGAEVPRADAVVALPDLAPAALAILAIVASKGRAHAYEVVREAYGRGGALGASESSIYRYLKDLVDKGLLSAVAARKGKRNVSAYLVTDRAERALSGWVLAELDDRPDLSHAEVISKVRAAKLVPRTVARVALKKHAADIADDLEDLAYEERQARRSADWDDVLKLEFELRQNLMRAFVKFAEDARELFARDAGDDGD